MAAAAVTDDPMAVSVDSKGCGSKTFYIDRPILVLLDTNIGATTFLPSGKAGEIRLEVEGVGEDSGVTLTTEYSRVGDLMLTLRGGCTTIRGVNISCVGTSCLEMTDGKTFVGGVEMNIPRGKSVAVVDGAVFVDGKLWQDDGPAAVAKETYPDPKLVVYCPPNLNYIIIESSSATVTVPHELRAGSVRLDIANGASCTFNSTAGDVTVETANNAVVNLEGSSICRLNVDSCNGSNVVVRSVTDSVIIDASNSARVTTYGDCTGRYLAEACNSAAVCNFGKIGGSMVEKCCNSGTVDFGPNIEKRLKTKRGKRAERAADSTSDNSGSSLSSCTDDKPSRKTPCSSPDQQSGVMAAIAAFCSNRNSAGKTAR